jgi:hypothetical protein
MLVGVAVVPSGLVLLDSWRRLGGGLVVAWWRLGGGLAGQVTSTEKDDWSRAAAGAARNQPFRRGLLP